jgi:hypothetical protein
MRLLLISVILLFTSCSVDQNFAVKEIDSPTGNNSSLPRLYTDNSGIVFMSWVESKNDTSSLLYSRFIDNSWEKPSKISSSVDWFVNWADFPSVIARDGSAVAAHWLKKVEGGTYAYNVELVSSKDNWSNPITPHSDDTPTEHGFVSMVPVSDTTFMSIWLDGRNTIGHGGHDSHDMSSDLSSAMTLRSAILDLELNVLNEYEIDDSVCDCCGTSAVETTNGFITAYRNRTSEEIRDIYVSRYINGKWSDPLLVSNDQWEIAACPVNGPSLASKDNTVAVVWYTGANDREQVKLAISNDEGSSFDQPIIIDNGSPLGRVDIEIFSNGNMLVSWMERNTQDRSKANFMAKLVSRNGKIISEFSISSMQSSRRSGFPQISSYNNKIIAAWTDIREESGTTIKTAILE